VAVLFQKKEKIADFFHFGRQSMGLSQ